MNKATDPRFKQMLERIRLDSKLCAAEGCSEEFTGPFDLCPSCYDIEQKRMKWARLRRPEESRQAKLQKAQAPAKVWKKRFKEPSPWPGKLHKWRGEPWSVYLHGVTGDGKTFLACELALRVRPNEGLVKLPDGTKTAVLFLDCAYVAEKHLANELRPYREVGALVLDEVGRGISGRAVDYLVDLVRFREGHELPTVFTSQYSLEKLSNSDAGDGSMIDRIRPGVVVQLPKKSRR